MAALELDLGIRTAFFFSEGYHVGHLSNTSRPKWCPPPKLIYFLYPIDIGARNSALIPDGSCWHRFGKVREIFPLLSASAIAQLNRFDDYKVLLTP